MRPELDAGLLRDFPKLYAGVEDLRAIKYTHWGFECGDGWEPLIRRLSAEIERIRGCTNVRAVQVKEKFGTLRFYISGGTAEIYDIIDKYELESARVCEQCGNPGSTRVGRWVHTLCDTCHQRMEHPTV